MHDMDAVVEHRGPDALEIAPEELTTPVAAALVSAARRVDASLQQTRTSPQIQNAWSSIRAQLAELDATCR